MGKQRFKIIQIKLAKKLTFTIYYYLFFLLFIDMYSLYDKDGVLRFINSDREACLDYAKLFELNSSHCCLINLIASMDKQININLDPNQAENNN